LPFIQHTLVGLVLILTYKRDGDSNQTGIQMTMTSCEELLNIPTKLFLLKKRSQGFQRGLS
jgi:hypothetical protein